MHLVNDMFNFVSYLRVCLMLYICPPLALCEHDHPLL